MVPGHSVRNHVPGTQVTLQVTIKTNLLAGNIPYMVSYSGVYFVPGITHQCIPSDSIVSSRVMLRTRSAGCSYWVPPRHTLMFVYGTSIHGHTRCTTIFLPSGAARIVPARCTSYICTYTLEVQIINLICTYNCSGTSATCRAADPSHWTPPCRLESRLDLVDVNEY